ncbi:MULTISPECIES: sigma-70 family RNA polymerase sigma factor [unclassified Paenibacillus]|uniref:sigma-70 family RNA polymerase sigma factor n=1 Tax=unclassified Paenibacillus TaxID=185978 RepID=UPI00095648A5|nr:MULTISPECIES: sigma-70 family RNA polymerase sigma factor [unclassified Paenibacillus]ASS67246.1 sigma-70 family RNA polymerase sigma factor [Paenibacillus sp. RUD330]SIQ84304.1 RNA polymerase sigma-70 factor, ECF subfamily [Paenibacillus sp. RU4X]SIR05178.1 RNA polymerase sigma-70 factor, ECF subfamily [Paenibacillus sp. RU4T]
MTGSAAETLYRSWKGYVFAIAYRMLGSAADAEDVVQDLFAELQGDGIPQPDHPKAYLTRAAVNRSLNMLKSARRKREQYVGQWLPEPLPLQPDENGPEQLAESREALGYAYMVLMEKLLPAERAVFVMHEAYQYDYRSIGEWLGKSEAACRQLGSRARRKLQLGEGAPLPAAYWRMQDDRSKDRRKALLERFLFAFERHQVDELRELLAADAVMVTDGGGIVRSALNPIVGAKRVHAFTASPKTFQKLRRTRTTLLELNGELQALFWEDDRLHAVLCFKPDERMEHLKELYLLTNPEKLESIQHRLNA